MARFLNVPHKEFNSARSGSILQFLTFWGFISFYFGLFGLYCFVFAFWGIFISYRTACGLLGFISFYFGLFGLYCFVFAFWGIFISYRTACGHGQTKVQAPGPPNLEKIPQNRQRADQGPNLWATKPGENCMLTAAASKKPPKGRPKSKPMGHQTWRKLHAYGNNVDETANGQTKAQSRSRSWPALRWKQFVAVQGSAHRGEATSSRV